MTGSRSKEEPLVYPLYGSTFTVYRLSPLYHGHTPLFNDLATHARRLREALTGDSLRGVQIAAELSGFSNSGSSGSLKECTWQLLGDEEAWERAHHQTDEADEEDNVSTIPQLSAQDARGLLIELRYEKATHKAILLGDAQQKSTVPGFTSFPLLFIRMPVPVKETFVNYLSTSFDTRVSPMKFRPSFLSMVLEHMLERILTPTSSESSAADVNSLARGLQLQLSFPSTTPLLKNLDITVPKDDISKFVSTGETHQQAYYNQSSEDIIDGDFSKSQVTGPFTHALSSYLKQHLALSLQHPAVVLSKVALGPFAFSCEGKLKMLESSPLAQELWDLLFQETQTSRFDEKTAANSSGEHLPGDTAMEIDPIRGRSKSRFPTEPPPPYELHDPARSRMVGQG